MPHSYHNLLTHAVFSTKDRLPTIHSDFKSDLYAYMGGIVRELKGSALLINGMPDHVHMLLRVPANLSTSDCMLKVKTNSSRWIHEKFPQHKRFSWQHGFAAFSVSESAKPQVLQYIREQEHHHRKVTFQEELRMFLVKNNVIFDEQYIWK